MKIVLHPQIGPSGGNSVEVPAPDILPPDYLVPWPWHPKGG